MRQELTPLIYTVGGMAGRDARSEVKRLVKLLAEKWQREYSEMAGFIRARMSLAVVRSNTMLLIYRDVIQV